MKTFFLMLMLVFSYQVHADQMFMQNIDVTICKSKQSINTYIYKTTLGTDCFTTRSARTFKVLEEDGVVAKIQLNTKDGQPDPNGVVYTVSTWFQD